ncbi:NAD-dependent epimerase/dehydratase family protein [Streptosporangium lutulentum]|uniref:2'-hydroxyisoflavone reductase n=1 Tax=Streptosporangium lutulentum TaxID=1461250 RepID=A0ABT9QQN1_9ACTN|nr:NAD-dependent epimerase/dehydratase family protein [Streptosporangium lutulentum]MDP9848706.1 2'-hydroxyisoflavone reductase [Streptosporangium lutulentum]
MRILIIGGTRFVGRHITEAALAAGHEVSLIHRGKTGPDLFPEAEHLLADRDADLSILSGRRWDATIDVSAYLPSQVTHLAGALATDQYVFVSTVAVYDPKTPNFTEDAPLAEFDGPVTEEVTGKSYGPLKVLCERAAVDAFGSATLIVRPTYVIGPYDYTGRFTYWVNRIARGGEVLAPGNPDDLVQVIDGRDMASWMIAMIEKKAPGTFHAVSPTSSFTFGDMLEAIVAEVGPPGTTLTWVGQDFLLAEGETGRSLPLWSQGGNGSATNTANPAAAYAAGLSPRPLGTSIREIRDADASFSTDTTITPDREADLLSRWGAQQ